MKAWFSIAGPVSLDAVGCEKWLCRGPRLIVCHRLLLSLSWRATSPSRRFRENRNTTNTLEVAWMKSISGDVTDTCDFDGVNPFGIQERGIPGAIEYVCQGYQGCPCALVAILVAFTLQIDSNFQHAISRFFALSKG